MFWQQHKKLHDHPSRGLSILIIQHIDQSTGLNSKINRPIIEYIELQNQQWHKKAALSSLYIIAINVVYIERVEYNAYSLQ